MAENSEKNLLGEMIVDLQKISNRNYSPKIKVGLAIAVILMSSFLGSAATKFFLVKNRIVPVVEYVENSQDIDLGYEYQVLRK